MLLNSPLKGLLIYTHTIAISESLFLQSWTYYDFLKLYVQAINILDSELFFFWITPHSLWYLSSPTRDWTRALSSERAKGNSPELFLDSRIANCSFLLWKPLGNKHQDKQKLVYNEHQKCTLELNEYLSTAAWLI